jgi:hypothetical protein
MNKVLTLNEMQNMNIDEITGLYRDGYTIEENINEQNMENLDPKIVSADVSISTGSLFVLGAAALIYIFVIK